MRMFRRMRSAGALLCAALTVAFAAASAGSVLDGAVHELHAPHSHSHVSFASAAHDDHHDMDSHDADGGKAPHDHAGLGHHHHFGDGPTGFVTDTMASLSQHPGAAGRFRRADEARARPFSGGVERPPKTLDRIA
jgi:uncharacterized protein involved in copper resistance